MSLPLCGRGGGSLSPVDRLPVYLVFVEALVQVKAFEQELDHRRTRLRPVRQAQLLQRRRQLGQVAERARVGARRNPLTDLEHDALFELRDDTVELRSGKVAAEHRADRAALQTREDLLLLALVERFDLHASGC